MMELCEKYIVVLPGAELHQTVYSEGVVPRSVVVKNTERREFIYSALLDFHNKVGWMAYEDGKSTVFYVMKDSPKIQIVEPLI